MNSSYPVMEEEEKPGFGFAASLLNSSAGRWIIKTWQRALQNPYLLFLPFLFLFIAYVLLKNNDAFESDEARYFMFSEHLLNGYYSDPAPGINLWNGPGYPIFLMPFVALKLPLVIIPLMNALFHYLSVVFLFKALSRIASVKAALFFSLFWALYYNGYAEMPFILTESLTAFLVSAIGLCAVIGFSENKRWHIIGAGLLFGYLVLVKIIFSNVLLALLLATGILWIFNRKKPLFRNAFIIPVVALLINIPYLFYTWNLTGKKLYWRNSGGMSLYWMSTPFEKEYGEWHNATISLYDRNETADSTIMFNEKKLQDNHRADYAEIYALPAIEQDDAFKKKAIANIKAHPVKFVKNIIANGGRLVFDYPYSYTYQTYTSLLRVSINGILLTLMLLSAFLTLLNWRKIPFSVRFVLMAMLLYLGGSLLVSVYARMFYIILPWMLLWVGFVLDKTVSIRFSISENIKKQKLN